MIINDPINSQRFLIIKRVSECKQSMNGVKDNWIKNNITDFSPPKNNCDAKVLNYINNDADIKSHWQ